LALGDCDTTNKLNHTAGVPLILYPKAPRPSHANEVLSFYRNLGIEPNVAFEVRQLWTASGLVAAAVGIALSFRPRYAGSVGKTSNISFSMGRKFPLLIMSCVGPTTDPAAGTHPQAHRRVRPVD
jgi:hypothetical protein